MNKRMKDRMKKLDEDFLNMEQDLGMDGFKDNVKTNANSGSGSGPTRT